MSSQSSNSRRLHRAPRSRYNDYADQQAREREYDVYCERVEREIQEQQEQHKQQPQWNSIYIPVIPSDLATQFHEDDEALSITTKEQIAYLFESEMHFGQVSRVDMVSSFSHAGRPIQSAFVHFFNINKAYREQLTMTGGNLEVHSYSSSLGQFKRFVSYKTHAPRFISIKINHKPIPNLHPNELDKLNVEQLIAKITAMQTLIDEQTAKLASLMPVVMNTPTGPMSNEPMTKSVNGPLSKPSKPVKPDIMVASANELAHLSAMASRMSSEFLATL